jgi:DHA1 family bicyclomycin/chloramphenicol resistance-like MFS transporter
MAISVRRAPPPGLRVALLSLAIGVGQLATSLYLPSLPAMAADLQIGPAVASWTLTCFYISFAVCNLVAGPLADAMGRRPVLLAGLLIYAVGTLVCAWAPSILPFMAGRLIQAAGAAAAPVVGRAMLRDVQKDGSGTRAMIWVSMAMAAAPAFGPPLGGLIQQTLGWRATFWLLAAAGVLMLVLAASLLDETLPLAARSRTRGLVRRYAGLLRDEAYCRNVGALSALFAGLGVFFATGPFIFIKMLGFSPVAYGVLNLANVAGYLAGSTIAGRLSHRTDTAALVRAGTRLALAGGAAMALLAALGIVQAWAILGPVVLLTLGFGFVLPAGTAGALDRHPAQAGLASALLGFIQVAAAAGGTAVAGAMLGQGGTFPVSCVFLVLTALAAWSAHGLRTPRPGPVMSPAS